MSEIKRIFLIVLDSVGAGEAPDAAEFGDVGAHTLKSLWQTGSLNIENLRSLGIGNIEGLSFLGTTDAPLACVARMRERSMGKDTTVGHWEIAGHVSARALPTFPDGFGESILEKIKKISGREILCNKPYSGTAVIDKYGKEAFEKKALIVYTSADSVLQIAAHTDVVPLEELYRVCSELRGELTEDGEAVGRIIARPFNGGNGNFKRTADRRDYSLKPPICLLPESLKKAGFDSISVGKISDIFAGVGFTRATPTHSNQEGMKIAEAYIESDFSGLCFVNLVDFDMLWGHRRDANAYARGLGEFDVWLGSILPKLRDDDLFIITADHGCDPCFTLSTDHTREYTPFIAYGKVLVPDNFGTRDSFADIGATIADLFGIDFDSDGEPIKLKFLK